MFRQLWVSMSSDVGNHRNPKREGSRKRAGATRKGEIRLCGFREVDSQTATASLSEGDPEEARLERGEASLNDLFPMDHEVAPQPASLAGRLSTAQLKDPNLASALQQVTVVNGKPIEGVRAGNI